MTLSMKGSYSGAVEVRILLKATKFLYIKARALSTSLAQSLAWNPPGLTIVSNLVCSVHKQDLKTLIQRRLFCLGSSVS